MKRKMGVMYAFKYTDLHVLPDSLLHRNKQGSTLLCCTNFNFIQYILHNCLELKHRKQGICFI